MPTSFDVRVNGLSSPSPVATTAIAFEHVSKVYPRSTHADSLRELLAAVPRRLLSRGSWRRRMKYQEDLVRAVCDVSFDIRRGDVLGLVGANGAGKSTILKLIAGIARPTEGRVDIRGRVGSLIELGAGFHPDLSGRENVFLNGQIMGMSRREIAARYDDIVDFAELSDFMDTPVKRYSTGMYARLGFAVAAHLDPDILLVDEVLSVGDASFQRKSVERMVALVRRGQTVVFVSHSLGAVERICQRVLWLDHGRTRALGNTRQVLEAYLRSEEDRFVRDTSALTLDGAVLAIEAVRLMNREECPSTEFRTGEDMFVEIQYRAEGPVRGLRFAIGVTIGQESLFTANMLIDGHSVSSGPGPGRLRCVFSALPLNPGAYQLFGEVWGAQRHEIVVPWSEWARFRITDTNRDDGAVPDDYSVVHAHADAPIAVNYEWSDCD